MKKFLVGITLTALMACSAPNAETPHSLVTGPVNSTDVLQNPEFRHSYDAYQPSADALSKMQALEGKTLLVLFGYWCHDSAREVPRLLKLIEQSGVELQGLKLVAVDYDKRDPQGLAEKHDLKYTPTIYLLDGDQELGRIIERPESGLAEDLRRLTLD